MYIRSSFWLWYTILMNASLLLSSNEVNIDLLIQAIRENNIYLCEKFIKEQPNLANSISKSLNSTALVSAAEGNRLDILKLLLMTPGIEVNIREPIFNETALFKASFNGYLEVAKLLIADGADVKLHIKNKETCLMWAAFKGHLEIVLLLIQNGAGVNVQDDKYGLTPLMVAARNGYEDVVKLLLEKGANVNLLDKKKNTASAISFSRGEMSIGHWLESLETSPHPPSTTGVSADKGQRDL